MIVFVNAPDMVLAHADHFFATLTPQDLKARHATTVEEYKSLYAGCILEKMPQTHASRLLAACQRAAKALSKYPRILCIPWKIAILGHHPQKRLFIPENGYPHTHGDIIVLTVPSLSRSTKELALLLIHEQLHVFQRTYPVETQLLLLNYWKLRVTSLHRGSLDPRARANPDIGQLVYNGCYQRFKDNEPRDLGDSDVHHATDKVDAGWLAGQYEHPFEAMAYLISGYITDQGQGEAIPRLLVEAMVEWMDAFL